MVLTIYMPLWLNSTWPNWALEDGSTFQSWAAFLATASEHESGKLSRAPCKLIRVEGNGSVKNSWNRNFWGGFGFLCWFAWKLVFGWCFCSRIAWEMVKMDLGIKYIYTCIYTVCIYIHIFASVFIGTFAEFDASQIPQAPTHKNTMIEVLVWFNHHSYRKGAGFQTQRAQGMKRQTFHIFFWGVQT